MKKRLKDVSKEIENIVGLMAKTGSTSLLNKLDELEKEKTIAEFNIERMKDECRVHEVNESELRKSFGIARDLFKSGKLSTCKKLIDLYVDSVIVYEGYIELRVKIKPGLSVNPEKVLRNKSGSILSPQALCGYRGAGGGT